MSNWTPEQFKEYAQRRLKQEEPARAKMAGTRSGYAPGYNTAVVTAFFREHEIPEPRYEYQFDPDRRWRWDLAWFINDHKGVRGIALECNGGLWSGGAHVRPARMLKEYEKWNEGTARGWRILFCTPQTLCTAATADLVRRCLGL
jgi:hypothetical protein